jgi:hypothetical protein
MVRVLPRSKHPHHVYIRAGFSVPRRSVGEGGGRGEEPELSCELDLGDEGSSEKGWGAKKQL